MTLPGLESKFQIPRPWTLVIPYLPLGVVVEGGKDSVSQQGAVLWHKQVFAAVDIDQHAVRKTQVE